MKIVLESKDEREKERCRHYLETYMNAVDDPLGCEPACRDLSSPGCDHCIKEHIDYLMKRLEEKGEVRI